MKKLMDEKLVFFDVEAKTPKEVITFLAQKMQQDERVSSVEGYVGEVLAREEHTSTAVGFLVATPHAKTDHALHATVAFARLKTPIIWDEDEEEVSVVFQLAIPEQEKGARHLQILAKLSRMLMHDDFREKVYSVKTQKELIELVGDV